MLYFNSTNGLYKYDGNGSRRAALFLREGHAL